MNREEIEKEKINQVTPNQDVSQDNRNAKEKLYDKIPITLKTLDIVIGVLIAILVILLLYFIIRRFS
jgi:uncharacterized membrane protein